LLQFFLMVIEVRWDDMLLQPYTTGRTTDIRVLRQITGGDDFLPPPMPHVQQKAVGKRVQSLLLQVPPELFRMAIVAHV